MLITSQNLSVLSASFNAAFMKGREGAASHYKNVALTVPSSTGEEQYGWLKQLPSMREWLGPRIVHSLSVSGYTIKNRLFESTISVPRVAIEDDNYGLFSPVLSEMGKSAQEHPDELVFTVLKNGFTTNCFDDQFFFDSDHPIIGSDNIVTTVSNVQSGSDPTWFLLDTSRAIKPTIFQERIPYELQEMTKSSDEPVFKNDEYLYGVRARANVGYGLWQLAFGSKGPLTAANYEAARAAMMAFEGEGGRPLGVKPDTLVAPPSLEGAALRLLNTEYGTGGVSNEWKGTAKLIVTPWVA